MRVISVLILYLFSSTTSFSQNDFEGDHFTFDNNQQKIFIGDFDFQINKTQINLKKKDSAIHKYDVNAVFCLQKGNKNYFLKAGTIKNTKKEVLFQDLNWLDGNIPSNGLFKLYTTNATLEQEGSVYLTTIGDSQLIYLEAQQIRQKLNSKIPALLFKGNYIDKYGYPHEAVGGRSSKEVLNTIKKIEPADYYVLLLGTNDLREGLSINASINNMKQIITTLLSLKKNAKVYYITPMPTTKSNRDLYNLNVAKEIVNQFKNELNFKTIRFGEALRENNNWADIYLHKDGLHQGANSVNLLVELLYKSLIKEIY